MTTAVVGDELARIRSIKPDFFTSEKIGGLALSARLTFIGLWTHVDDNGVTVDNDRLITAALWPLEENPLEALARTSGDLVSLAESGLIRRYEIDGRRYLFITSWEEHQKISHPSKPRYPRPVTSKNTDPPPHSGRTPETPKSPPETLRPEQGAGSREQGKEQGAGIPVTAVGGLTDRNARGREAPSAQPKDHFVARKVIAAIPHYRTAPGWVRKHLAPLIGAALDAGFGHDAIVRYAGMVIGEGRFLDRQHIPEARDALRRLGRDIEQGTACRHCGDQPARCPCHTAAPPGDQPWTADDQAALERALAHLAPTPDELAQAQEAQ